MIKKKIFLLFTVFLINILFINNNIFATASRMRCSVNSECRPGFVCVGGIGDDAGTSIKKGCCEAILPLRQVCIFHNLLTGVFGKGVTALVIISMGMAGIFGKLQMKSLLAFFVGVVCIFGSYQVVNLLTKYNYQICELVDTSITPGQCSDYSEEETLITVDI